MANEIITKKTPRFNLESRRYIGCKAKLVDWIFELIEQETQDVHSFCDIFAGTGSVSNRAVQLYDHVVINDFLYSNHMLYNAFFGNGDWDEEKVLQIINEFNGIDAKKLPGNYFSDNYGDKYFDLLSAKKIGYIRDLIEERKDILTEKEYSVLIASLIYSIDRIANTLGHFEAYRKVKIKPQNLVIRLIDVRRSTNVEIFQKDANELAREIHTDVLYMDPPYNSRQYSRFYHVYEVLVKWDKPVLYSDAAKPKFTENNSDYCRTAALSAFTDLVAHVDTRYIVVSYNNTYNSKSSSSENKIKIEQIIEVLNQCGETSVFEHKHQAFNAGKTDFDDHKEFLFITEVDYEKRNRSFAALLCG